MKMWSTSADTTSGSLGVSTSGNGFTALTLLDSASKAPASPSVIHKIILQKDSGAAGFIRINSQVPVPWKSDAVSFTFDFSGTPLPGGSLVVEVSRVDGGSNLTGVSAYATGA